MNCQGKVREFCFKFSVATLSNIFCCNYMFVYILVMEKFVILASRPDIRVFSLDTKYRVGIKIPLTGLKIVMDVDYDSVDQMLYWTDSGMNSYGVIKRATLDGSGMYLIIIVFCFVYICVVSYIDSFLYFIKKYIYFQIFVKGYIYLFLSNIFF